MSGYFGESARQPLVAGHRGAKDLWPENTMLGYRNALALGVDMLEIDLTLTRDGQLAMIHDRSVNRTTNGTGLVQDFSLAELQTLDAGQGEKIPEFGEFLAWASQTPLYLNVEIKTKTHETVDKAVALLARHKMLDRCVLACFDAAITEYACWQYAVKTQGFPRHAMRNFHEHSYDFLYSVGIELCDLTPALVDEFNGRGIQPWCWCPDTPEEVARMHACGSTLCTCNDPRPALLFLNKM
ncbi:MAG: glycerophosphodiester phosphodiesterase [Oscillospiraceae bacterium]|jgi:glycerophosphoryl diester phosphodiesterase|nr:glycerophosphodiester phosphodiesterase [Oscillospiraceae bacterium]